MNMLKTLILAIVVCVGASSAEAGLLGGLRGGRGGGGGECADGSCGSPIGMGLKRPGKEVGQVTGDGMIVKMYEAQPEQPQPIVERVVEESPFNPLLLLLAICPLALALPLLAGGGTYLVIRKAQESSDD